MTPSESNVVSAMGKMQGAVVCSACSGGAGLMGVLKCLAVLGEIYAGSSGQGRKRLPWGP